MLQISYYNPTCKDLILTNAPRSFHSTYAVERGLSDFHLMTMTVKRKSFKKYQPVLSAIDRIKIFQILHLRKL